MARIILHHLNNKSRISTLILFVPAMAVEAPSNKGDDDFMEGVTNMLSVFEGMILDEWSELRQDIFGRDKECQNINTLRAKASPPWIGTNIVTAGKFDDGIVSAISSSLFGGRSSRESSVAYDSNHPIPSSIYFRNEEVPVRDSAGDKAFGGFQSFSQRMHHKRFLPSKWGRRTGLKSKTWTNKFALRRHRRATNQAEEDQTTAAKNAPLWHHLPVRGDPC
jgi:hypothetical protein